MKKDPTGIHRRPPHFLLLSNAFAGYEIQDAVTARDHNPFVPMSDLGT